MNQAFEFDPTGADPRGIKRRSASAIGWRLVAAGLVLLISSVAVFVVIEVRCNQLLHSGARADGVVAASYPSDWWNVLKFDYSGKFDVRFETPRGPTIARIYTTSRPIPTVGSRYTVVYDRSRPTVARGLGGDTNERPQWLGFPLFLGILSGLAMAIIGGIYVSVAGARFRRVPGDFRLNVGRVRAGALRVESNAVTIHAPKWFPEDLVIPSERVVVADPGDPAFDDQTTNWIFDPPLITPYVTDDGRLSSNLFLLFATPVVTPTAALDGVHLRVRGRKAVVARFGECGYQVTTRPTAWLLARHPVSHDPTRVAAATRLERRQRWSGWISWAPFVLLIAARATDDGRVLTAAGIAFALLGALWLAKRVLDSRDERQLNPKMLDFAPPREPLDK